MLVVIPVCRKDADLALANLKWAAQLATYKKGLPNPGAGGDGGGSTSTAFETKPGEGFGDAMARMAAAAGLVQR